MIISILANYRYGIWLIFKGTSTVREDAYEKAVHYLGVMFEQAARETASKLTPAKNIIDIGAGSGIWSLSMATGRDDVK